MFLRFYYQLKPLLPAPVRVGLRRMLARRTRRLCRRIWPIDPYSGTPPEGWQGWPDGKQFAFVLTHDVEGQQGLERCQRLAEVDQGIGFRANFNFVPEGSYDFPRSLRKNLVSRGFEIGVHDLHHNGKLYGSREIFRSNAVRINHYLEEWGAVGFRSGFMLHNLEWLHDLNILYDMSTFDVDPFEPQPDGTHTIFPFWVPNRDDRVLAAPAVLPATSPETKPGYVELPYTLPQDSTLFLVLQETSIAIWKQKLAWIAERGGMALLTVHPDYMSFNGGGGHTYPVRLYQEFLEHVRSEYAGQYWNALPKEVASFVASRKGSPAADLDLLEAKAKV